MEKNINLDISELRNLNIYQVTKEYNTLIINHNNNIIRFTFYENDVDKTIKSFKSRIKELNIKFKLEEIQQIIFFISKNWLALIGKEINNGEYNRNKTSINFDINDDNNKKNKFNADSKTQLSLQEWKIGLKEKLDKLKSTVIKNIPDLWAPLEFAISIKTILNINDINLPFAGIILGPPSSLKTLLIELFREYKNTFYTDNFSAKSFVSHNTSVAREKLIEVDLLPKIKGKLFLTPELSPTFSKKDEELNEILGIITRILDGHGYESDTGAHGHRGYNEEIMFVWLGAAVDIPRKVYKLLGTLGPKLYFYRIPKKENKSEDDYLNEIKNYKNNFQLKVREIKHALFIYLYYLERGPEFASDNSNNSKISWNTKEKDDDNALKCIIRLAQLLSHLRGVVPTWETKNTQGSDYSYAMPIIEEPTRAMTQLQNLARGHALSQGRNYITMDDIPLIIKVVLSTASRERVILFDQLLKEEHALVDSGNLKESLKISKPTALRTMTELSALDLVIEISVGDGDNAPKQIMLKDKFSWFTTFEFKELRSNFAEEYQKEYLKEKIEEIQRQERKENNPPTNEYVQEQQQQRINESNIIKDDNFPIMVFNPNNYSLQLYEKSPYQTILRTLLSNENNPLQIKKNNINSERSKNDNIKELPISLV